MKLLRDQIIRAVAELPDRTSPADQPDMMLVSAAELDAILAGVFGEVPAEDVEGVTAGELSYRTYCAASEAHHQEAEPELTLRMLERWMPLTLPANEQGQVHFIRAMADSAATCIRKMLEARATVQR